MTNVRDFRLGEGELPFTFQSDDPVDREELIKELTDLKYVIDQLCACFGYDKDDAYSRVHRSNMSKLEPNGEIKRQPEG